MSLPFFSPASSGPTSPLEATALVLEASGAPALSPEQLVSLLPPPPQGAEHDALCEEHMHGAVGLWRARRSDRSSIRLPGARAAGEMIAPGRAWPWKAFQSDPRPLASSARGVGGDTAIVHVHVRRALLVVEPAAGSARAAGLVGAAGGGTGRGHSPPPPPRARYRVAASLLPLGFPEDSPAPADDSPASLRMHDCTSAQSAVSLTAAAHAASSGAIEDLPHLPLGVRGVAVASWHETLVTATGVPAPPLKSQDATTGPPPLVLRVQVLAEAVAVGAEHAPTSPAGNGAGGLSVAVGLVASIDLGLSAPLTHAADPTKNDPVSYRLRLEWPQPPQPPQNSDEHPLPPFPIAFLELDVQVQRRGWPATGVETAGAGAGVGAGSVLRLVQLLTHSVEVPQRLVGRPVVSSSSSSVLGGSHSGNATTDGGSPGDNSGTSGSESEGGGGGGADAVGGEKRRRKRRGLSPERQELLSPSKGIGNVGRVTQPTLKRSPNSFMGGSLLDIAREGWAVATTNTETSHTDALGDALLVPSPAAIAAHARCAAVVRSCLETQGERYTKAVRVHGKGTDVPGPGESTVLALAIRRLPRPVPGSSAPGVLAERARAIILAPPPLLGVPCPGAFVDLEAAVPAARRLAASVPPPQPHAGTASSSSSSIGDGPSPVPLVPLSDALLTAPGSLSPPALAIDWVGGDGVAGPGSGGHFNALCGSSLTLLAPTASGLATSAFAPSSGGSPESEGMDVLIQLVSIPQLALRAVADSLMLPPFGPIPCTDGQGVVLAVARLPLAEAVARLGLAGGGVAVDVPLAPLPLWAPEECLGLYCQDPRATGASRAPPLSSPIAYLHGSMRMWPSSSGHAPSLSLMLSEAALEGDAIALQTSVEASRVLQSNVPLPPEGDGRPYRPVSVSSIADHAHAASMVPPPPSHTGDNDDDAGSSAGFSPPDGAAPWHDEDSVGRGESAGSFGASRSRPPHSQQVKSRAPPEDYGSLLSRLGLQSLTRGPPYADPNGDPFDGTAADAAAGALLAANAGGGMRASLPLVRRLIAELDRRTIALRTCGTEIVKLRRELRLSRESAAASARATEENARSREVADDAVLLAALRDLGPVLLESPAGPGPGLSALAALSAQQLLQALRAADPSGERVVPTLLRRLAVVAHKYVQQRKGNTALASEVYLSRTRVRLLERELRSLAAAAVAAGGAAGVSAAGSALSAARAAAASMGEVFSAGALLTAPSLAAGVAMGGHARSSLDAASTSRSLGVGPLAGLGSGAAAGGFDSVAGALLAAEAAMGVNMGGLTAPLNAGPGAYTSAVVSGSASIDPAAPVSALAHARLLDQYAASVEALERAREDGARAQAGFDEVREAATQQAAVLQRMQAARRSDAALRATVRSQQELLRRMEAACDGLHVQLGEATARANAAEKRQRAAERAARIAAGRAEEAEDEAAAAGAVPRLDPASEGSLRARLASAEARSRLLEDQLQASSRAFAHELTALQGRVMELEAALARRDAADDAAGAAASARAARAADAAMYRGQSHAPPAPARRSSGSYSSYGNSTTHAPPPLVARPQPPPQQPSSRASTPSSHHLQPQLARSAELSKPPTPVPAAYRDAAPPLPTTAEQLEKNLADIDALLGTMQ